MTSAGSPQSRGVSPLERRILAVGTAVVLHAVVLGGAALMQAVVSAVERLPALPKEPLLLGTVALVLAHCSLGAIWWARSDLPSYAKTLVAAAASAGLWLILVGLLETTSMTETAGAAWAMCLAIQTLLAGLGAAVVELAVSRRSRGSRFTIMFLLLWTAVIGVLLGAGRRAVALLGWNLAELLAWDWFYQLIALGFANAALAVSLLAAIRLPRDWSSRLVAAGGATIALAIATPCAFLVLFGNNVGATFAEIFWLVLKEGLFVTAVLAPLEAAREQRAVAEKGDYTSS